MTEPVQESLSVVAARVLDFADLMQKDKLGVKGADDQVVAVAKADLVAVAQGLIDAEIRADEQRTLSSEAEDQVGEIIEILDAGGSAEQILADIRAVFGVDYPAGFVEALMTEGLSHEAAIRALSRMNEAMAGDSDVEMAEDVEVTELTVDDEDGPPAFKVTDSEGHARVIRPKMNPNPHVPEVDVAGIVGATRGDGGMARFDQGGL